MTGLQARGLTKHFAGLTALEDVDLELRQGEILGLIGPNGSGKTTTINLITGFLKPSAGGISVDGRDITGRSPHQVAQVGVRRTFQTIRLFEALTVHENVAVAGVSAGLSRREANRRAEEALERLDLTYLANVPAGSLPYGQERRLEVARALVAHPKYLLLDEPAAGMNESESDALLDALPAIVREYGCGLLIIDHDMRLIMRLCERLHVLNYGRTIAEGTPAEVREDPDVIAAYLGSGEATQ